MSEIAPTWHIAPVLPTRVNDFEPGMTSESIASHGMALVGCIADQRAARKQISRRAFWNAVQKAIVRAVAGKSHNELAEMPVVRT